jgi:hypothetical protein
MFCGAGRHRRPYRLLRQPMKEIAEEIQHDEEERLNSLSKIFICVYLRNLRPKSWAYAAALLLATPSCCACATSAPIPKNTSENSTSEIMPLRKNGIALV